MPLTFIVHFWLYFLFSNQFHAFVTNNLVTIHAQAVRNYQSEFSPQVDIRKLFPLLLYRNMYYECTIDRILLTYLIHLF